MEQNEARPGILLLHAWWGRNAFILDLAKRFEAEGFVVAAPDLYGGKVVATREEAQAMVDALDSDAADAQIAAALGELRADPRCNGKVGVVGFSLGVWFGLSLADEHPDDVDAVVVFYGTYDGPAERMRARVQAHLASDDEFEPAEMVETMREHFANHKVPLELNVYPGTKHWFFESDRPEFDAGAARMAWERTTEFLRRELG